MVLIYVLYLLLLCEKFEKAWPRYFLTSRYFLYILFMKSIFCFFGLHNWLYNRDKAERRCTRCNLEQELHIYQQSGFDSGNVWEDKPKQAVTETN